MAETKPTKKQGGTMQYQDPNSASGQDLRNKANAQDLNGSSYYSPDEEDLDGISVFGGYVDDKSKLKKGVQGPRRTKKPFNKTANGMLRTLLNKPNGDAWVRNLQEQLYRAGFYGNADRTRIAWGNPRDRATIEAYKAAITETSSLNYSGRMITVPEFLREAGDYRAENGLVDAGSQQGPFRPTVSNPADIKAQLNEILPGLMGRVPDDGFVDGLVKSFQNIQLSAQRQEYDTELAGGTTTAPMALDTLAAQEAEKRYPTEFGARRLADLSEQFLASIRSVPGEVNRTF